MKPLLPTNNKFWQYMDPKDETDFNELRTREDIIMYSNRMIAAFRENQLKGLPSYIIPRSFKQLDKIEALLNGFEGDEEDLGCLCELPNHLFNCGLPSTLNSSFAEKELKLHWFDEIYRTEKFQEAIKREPDSTRVGDRATRAEQDMQSIINCYRGPLLIESIPINHMGIYPVKVCAPTRIGEELLEFAKTDTIPITDYSPFEMIYIGNSESQAITFMQEDPFWYLYSEHEELICHAMRNSSLFFGTGIN